MASKKCPKCGEDNPAEAVMCWACYTPLSGGPAVAGMSAATASLGAKGPVGKGPVGVPNVEEESVKKGIDPRLIGAGAFLLVAGVIGFLVSSGMGGGTGTDTPTGVDPSTTSSIASQGQSSAPPAGSNAPSIGPSTSSGGGSAAVAPVALPFSTVAAPNPQFATGTVGILIAADKGGQAAGFARYAKDQLMKNGRWRNMQVAVFTDKATADQFKAYQSPRKGAPLTRADYSNLAGSGVWNNTPVFFEAKGRAERVYYPSKSPSGWWPPS